VSCQEDRVNCRIVDLTAGAPDLIEQAAVLLLDAFRDRTHEWQDLDSARAEVVASLAPERISRVGLDASGTLLGWIGGIPMYRGLVWELHPIVVAKASRGRGIGRALVEDFERVVAARGALTLWLGSDDENDETSLSRVDLYADVPGALRTFRTTGGEHPAGFYLRLGFRVVGVIPDANGRGKPDVLFAKRVAPGCAGTAATRSGSPPRP
jgi:aminoglycoside 6'-N-acetyltransferase I